jgi:hypothetical protein
MFYLISSFIFALFQYRYFVVQLQIVSQFLNRLVFGSVIFKLYQPITGPNWSFICFPEVKSMSNIIIQS